MNEMGGARKHSEDSPRKRKTFEKKEGAHVVLICF
jgi:hypothetical protein